MKIDVQGFEDRVLNGGEQTLLRTRVLIVEISFIELYSGQLLFDDLYSVIRNRGFSCVGFEEVSRDRNSGRSLQADAVFVRQAASREQDGSLSRNSCHIG